MGQKFTYQKKKDSSYGRRSNENLKSVREVEYNEIEENKQLQEKTVYQSILQ